MSPATQSRPPADSFGWNALFGLLPSPRVALAACIALGGGATTAVFGVMASSIGPFGAPQPGPSFLSLALAVGVAWALGFLSTEVLSDALKRPVARVQPALGAKLWRTVLIVGAVGALAAAFLGSRLEGLNELVRLQAALLSEKAAPVSAALHPRGYLGVALLGLGLGAWSGQHARYGLSLVAVVVSVLLAACSPRLVHELHGATPLNVLAMLAGLGLAAARWTPTRLIANAGPPDRSLLRSPSRARQASRRPARQRPLPPPLERSGAAGFWPAAARFELTTGSPMPFTSARLAATGWFLFCLCITVLIEVTDDDVEGWAGLQRGAAILLFGPGSVDGSSNAPVFTPYMPPVLFLSGAFAYLQPLSRRLLYPISRDERRMLALRGFAGHLAQLVITTGAIAIALTLVLIVTTEFRPPSGVPQIAVALAWALALPPWLASIGPHVGQKTVRSGSVAIRRALSTQQLVMLTFFAIAIFGTQVPSSVLLAAALPVALPGWWWLARKLRAEARGDLLPA